ncbi:MAG: NUDIX hydrolase [Pseudomonadota bacterium]
MKREIQPEFQHGGDKQVVSENVAVRDAATLLLVDWSFDKPRILTGTRKKTLAFMPGLTVFPGGAVDKIDGDMPVAHDLSTDTLQRLQLRAALNLRDARALALAAIRETFEETGALIGVRQQPTAIPGEVWQAFVENNVMPSLENLQLVARAITPPYRPRRFDTRFFMADAKDIAMTLPDIQETDLEDVAWLTLDEIFKKPLAFITQQVLTDIAPLLQMQKQKTREQPFPFYYSENIKYFVEMIG